MVTPWESRDNHWLLEGPIRFNLEAFHLEPLNESKSEIEILLECPAKPDYNFSLFLGKKLVSRHDGFPVTRRLENTITAVDKSQLVIALVGGEKASVAFPPIPKNCGRLLTPSWSHTLEMAGLQINITFRWIQPPPNRSHVFVNEIPIISTEPDSEDPMALPWNPSEAIILETPPQENESWETLLAQYVEELHSQHSKSKHVLEPNIDLYGFLKSSLTNFWDQFNLVKWVLGEVADSIRVYASLKAVACKNDCYDYLLVELVDDEETVLHAVKSKPLIADNTALLDLPVDGSVLRLTVIRENVDRPFSPSHTRSISPYGTKRQGSPSRIWERRNQGSIELRLSELNSSVISFELNVVKIKINIDLRNVIPWISRIIPAGIESSDPLILHVREWMKKCSKKFKHACPVGLVYSLDGAAKIIFEFAHIGIKTSLKSVEDVFAAISDIPTVRHPELTSIQTPWLTANQITEHNVCGCPQKSFLLSSFLKERFPTNPTVVALCRMRTSEIEFVVISNDRAWSVDRKKYWDLTSPDCPIHALCAIITDLNVHIFKSPKLFEGVPDLLAEATHTLFGPDDGELENLLKARLDKIPIEFVSI